MAFRFPNPLALLAAPAIILIAGCGGGVAASGFHLSESIKLSSPTTTADTGSRIPLTATLSGGEPASVRWSLSGGDPVSGPGSISPAGLYTPPAYLTQDSATVLITATSAADPAQPASLALTLSPGFLQPLTPGNLALGPGASATLSGSITQVGGTTGLRFTLAATPTGPSQPGLGTLSDPTCHHAPVTTPTPAYTTCAVTYTAPPVLAGNASVYLIAQAPGQSRSWTRVLLNPAGITSNPVAHQTRLPLPIPLGVSSGNNLDYDQSGGQLSDCCGGTLGALVQDGSGTQFVLSNNHVLARSDQAFPGETIIHPGLIDNACTPFGYGPGTSAVASLAGYPPLASPATNVDAALARPALGAVDPHGAILELGTRQPDGTLAPAPPGTSSTSGRGLPPTLGMTVAKSGRTTGLTCAPVTAIAVDVTIDYYSDCAETQHTFSHTFFNQIVVSGPGFSDAGDSGALVVDSATAEPVGLFYAGATDSNGIEQAIASPAADVLSALSAQVPNTTGPTAYTFVGTQDHPVTCLSASAVHPAATLAPAALTQAIAIKQRHSAALLKANSAIFGIGVGQNPENPAEAQIVLFVDRSRAPGTLPAALEGLRVRQILMDRPHVTRAHSSLAHQSAAPSDQPDFSFQLPLPR